MEELKIIVFLMVELLALGIAIFLAANFYFCVRAGGCPYVPTGKKRIGRIIEEADLKEGSFVLELGCGDGYFLRRAAQERKIKGLGVDIHGIALLKGVILARLAKIKNIKFQRGDLFGCDISRAQVIYLFLISGVLEKLAPKLKKECSSGTLIISHGFKLPRFDKYLFKELDHGSWNMSYQRKTYFYRYYAD